MTTSGVAADPPGPNASRSTVVRHRGAGLAVGAALLASSVWLAPQPTADDDGLGREFERKVLAPWTGDYDGMVERRGIRMLVPYDRTHFFLDGGRKRGLLAEAGLRFENHINAGRGGPLEEVHIAFVPVARNELIEGLTAGRGDIAAGGISMTARRRELVDFSIPTGTDVDEIVVTGTAGPELASVDDLSGKSVYVAGSSSYYESLAALNDRFEKEGKKPVSIETLDEVLNAGDILEMVHAGIIPATVVNDYLARFWAQVLDQLRVREDIVVADRMDLGWAFRKNSPGLERVVNDFLQEYRPGTRDRGVLLKRYLTDTRWIRNPGASDDQKRFELTIPLFEKFGAEYDLDPLLLAAQGYQESRLDQAARSPVGAVGIMQLMPATGESLGVGDVTKAEPNVHAGAKYMRELIDRYFGSADIDPLNQMLLSLAAYNAGPTRLTRLRKQAGDEGYDPNLWFNNVERVVARKVGREPVRYVRNIYRYYLVYRLAGKRRAPG